MAAILDVDLSWGGSTKTWGGKGEESDKERLNIGEGQAEEGRTSQLLNCRAEPEVETCAATGTGTAVGKPTLLEIVLSWGGSPIARGTGEETAEIRRHIGEGQAKNGRLLYFPIFRTKAQEWSGQIGAQGVEPPAGREGPEREELASRPLRAERPEQGEVTASTWIEGLNEEAFAPGGANLPPPTAELERKGLAGREEWGRLSSIIESVE
jgi:hypothetical protein